MTQEVLSLLETWFRCSTVASKVSISSRKNPREEKADDFTSKQMIIEPSFIDFMSIYSGENVLVRLSISWTEGISSPSTLSSNGTFPKWMKEYSELYSSHLIYLALRFQKLMGWLSITKCLCHENKHTPIIIINYEKIRGDTKLGCIWPPQYTFRQCKNVALPTPFTSTHLMMKTGIIFWWGRLLTFNSYYLIFRLFEMYIWILCVWPEETVQHSNFLFFLYFILNAPSVSFKNDNIFAIEFILQSRKKGCQ